MLHFDDVKEKVRELENDFNSKLVSLLNSCDEPIVLGLDPTFWKRTTLEECLSHPVTINIVKKADHPWNASPVYSASSTQTIN